MEKVKWKDSGCIRLTKMQLVSIEKLLNSSGQFSQDFHHCPFLGKIQEDLETPRIQPEEFTDRVIFMSMFNDTVRNAKDETCVSNAGKVKNFEKIFLAGRWTLLGPGSEEKCYGSTNHDQKGQ